MLSFLLFSLSKHPCCAYQERKTKHFIRIHEIISSFCVVKIAKHERFCCVQSSSSNVTTHKYMACIAYIAHAQIKLYLFTHTPKRRMEITLFDWHYLKSVYVKVVHIPNAYFISIYFKINFRCKKKHSRRISDGYKRHIENAIGKNEGKNETNQKTVSFNGKASE